MTGVLGPFQKKNINNIYNLAIYIVLLSFTVINFIHFSRNSPERVCDFPVYLELLKIALELMSVAGG